MVGDDVLYCGCRVDIYMCGVVVRVMESVDLRSRIDVCRLR